MAYTDEVQGSRIRHHHRHALLFLNLPRDLNPIAQVYQGDQRIMDHQESIGRPRVRITRLFLQKKTIQGKFLIVRCHQT